LDTPVALPMMSSRPVKRTGYLVITSDRGLAGAYNSNVLRKAFIRRFKRATLLKDEYAIIAIGKMGRDFLQKTRTCRLFRNDRHQGRSRRLPEIKDLANKRSQMFADGTFDELYMFYNHFVSAISSKR
jgi:F-type H+-transporting ATPase subunit gamma